MIDHSLLPNVALVDTGVLMRALGHKPDDPRSEACTEFVAAMIAAKKRLLIAAPTFAEMERGEPDLGAEAVPLPRTRLVIVVPFDDVAARELARQFPTAIATGIADETGLLKEDDRPWLLQPHGMVVVMLLRRAVSNLLALYRTRAQRSDDRRVMRWKSLMGELKLTLQTATPRHLAGLELRLHAAENAVTP